MESLEERVSLLENQLKSTRSGDASSSTAVQPANGHRQAIMASSKEADDSASELSSKVGMLELTTDGEEPRYLGSSSVFAFSRIIHSSLRQQSQSQPRGLGLREADTAIPSPCPLPDYDFGVTLSNAYFENIHPQYPFLHEPTFRGWEERFVRPSENMEELFFDPVPLFFINMVNRTLVDAYIPF